jgi:Transcription factor Opi1
MGSRSSLSPPPRPTEHVPTEDETLDVQIAAQALESLKGTSFLNKITKESTAGTKSEKLDADVETVSPRKRTHATLEEEISREKSNSNDNSPSITKKRTKWHSVIVTAASLASLSKDSRQRLRYLLHLLRLANDQLAAKVTSLQDLIAEQEATEMAQQIAANHVPSGSSDGRAGRTLRCPAGDTVLGLKDEIITTVRKAVTVISTFAGNSLPEPARSHIRNYILQLPNRWALSLDTPANALSRSSTVATTAVATAVPSGTISPVEKESNLQNVNGDTRNTDIEIGSRILSLAKESLDMLQHIMTIVGDTLDKAEMWCDTLGRPLVGNSSTVDQGTDSGEFDTATLVGDETEQKHMSDDVPLSTNVSASSTKLEQSQEDHTQHVNEKKTSRNTKRKRKAASGRKGIPT